MSETANYTPEEIKPMRIGQFTVSEDIMQPGSDDLHIYKMILENITPWRIVNEAPNQSLYIGFSELFEEADPTQRLPHYMIKVSNGVFSVEKACDYYPDEDDIAAEEAEKIEFSTEEDLFSGENGELSGISPPEYDPPNEEDFEDEATG